MIASSSRNLAVRQVEAGASGVDLNIGPQKKAGTEILPWLVQAVQEVVDVPLCLDTTNLAAIEEACKVVKQQPIINSTSAEEERLEKVPLVAKKYNTRLIALTMEAEGIPVSADARVNIALEKLLPRAEEAGPADHGYAGRSVGADRQRLPAVRARVHRGRAHPAGGRRSAARRKGWPEQRFQCRAERDAPLINRVYCVMLMGAGMNTMIADPLDRQLSEFIRIVEQRDGSSSLGRLLLALHDAVAVPAKS